MALGQKHLVKCRCVLPQFKRATNPPVHQFIVFSVVGDDDKVVPKFVQCNNCGLVHKVTDLCRSEILLGREHMSSIVTVDDIKSSIPERLASILDASDADLPTWESAKFIIDERRWGDFIVLSTDSGSGLLQGKYVRILGESLYKVESFEREEFVS